MCILQGNVGDSRVIASVKGEVQQLSFDHKPSNEAETKRIIAAGGWVEFNRVNGTVSVLFLMFSTSRNASHPIDATYMWK